MSSSTSSFITISDLPFIHGDDLSATLLSAHPSNSSTQPTSTSSQTALVPPTASPIAIIDVRDSDHIGGHIAGSRHVPSNTLDYRLPELLRELKEKKTVVFHCALSQQRGPSAALRYLRERRRMEEREREGLGGKKEGEKEEGGRQEVLVLEGGFVKWQEK
jgi:Cdc25 family phosphatase